MRAGQKLSLSLVSAASAAAEAALKIKKRMLLVLLDGTDKSVPFPNHKAVNENEGLGAPLIAVFDEWVSRSSPSYSK
jgi:hypothetical protein